MLAAPTAVVVQLEFLAPRGVLGRDVARVSPALPEAPET
jgi:hypothetical protein